MEGDWIISIKGAEEKATNKPLQRHGDTKEDAPSSTSSKESKADNEAPQTQGDTKEDATISTSSKEPKVDNEVPRTPGDTKEDKIISPFIEELIENAIEKTSKGNYDSSKMHKVPSMLRDTTASTDATIFNPKVISIGPYHKDTNLGEGEKLKPKIAKQFHQKHAAIPLGNFFRDFKNDKDIKGLNFEKLYGKDIIERFGDEKLKEMMFLDGCFILGFMKCIAKNQSHNLGMKNNLRNSVEQDLFLLENQLPRQVLQVLIELMKNNDSDLEDDVTDVIKYWNNKFLFTCNQYRSLRDDIKSSDHLLDIQYQWLLGKHSRHIRSCLPWSSKASSRVHLFRGVKELTEAGIKLRPSKTGSIKDVNFSTRGICGTLTLPHMTIDNSTKSMFFNLIAYEECTAKQNEFWFTSYISFLDLLIDHAEDVKELRTAGILDNRLGSDDQAAKLFNEMVVNFGLGSCDTYDLIKKRIRVHFDFRRKIWMVVWLLNGLCNHFNNSWACFAFFGAFIVASLAAIQTYSTVRPLS